MTSADDEHPGIHNGGSTRKRGRTRTPTDDDQPRGFQPTRMRRLWSDIDEARDRLGLGAAEGEPVPSWDVATLIARALEVTRDATGWMTELTRGFSVSLPTPCGVTRWLARVPVVGWLVALLPRALVPPE